MSSEESVYRLSHEILGHSADVRAVCYCPVEGPGGHVLLTASRDGTACVWQPEGAPSRGYVLKKTVRKHTGHVSSLCVIPEDRTCGREKVLFATGGQDTTVLVHSLEDDGQEPVQCYSGHKGTISCIIYQCGNLISASWDSTVRVWRSGGQCDVLEAHKPAVWAIAGLHALDNSNRILSAGADKLIRLWELDTKLCVQEYRGHTDVVRDVKVASRDHFFSAANDCVVRKWSTHTGQCLNQFYGHEAFVYSLSVLPGAVEDEFASCGEDKTIRVWRGDACVQVVPVPAVSVWCVTYTASGDIVAGSSDAVARIFSRSPDRQAPPEELKVYDDKVVQSRSTSTDNAIDISKLPGPEALSKPGRARGDNLIINNNGKAEVYQWNEEEADWVLIGNAMAKVPEKNNIYNGKEYDYVFDIELDEGSPSMRKLRLPYNKSMDPYLAAEDFLSRNQLPSYYLDQVAEFIMQNAGQYRGQVAQTQGDPFTGGSRYIPGSGGGAGVDVSGASDPFTGAGRYRPDTNTNGGGGGGGAGFASGGGADPFTGGSSYRPTEFASQQPEFNVSFKGVPPSNSFFPMSDFKLFTSPQDYYDKVLGKVTEFNANVDEDVKFSSDQLQRLKELGVSLSAGSSSVDTYDLMLVETLLRWPSQYTFPGLDLVRLVLCSAAGSRHFICDLTKGQSFLNTIMQFASDQSNPKNKVPVLRAVANFFAHDVGTQVMHSHRKWVLDRLSELFEHTNRTYHIALSTIVLNYCHYYSTKSASDVDGVKDCTEFINKILNSSYDLEAKFRALIGLGSLAMSSKTVLSSEFSFEDLCNSVQPLVSIKDPAKVGQCSQCVLQVLKN